jgi:CheY-like chemotaxis protein
MLTEGELLVGLIRIGVKEPSLIRNYLREFEKYMEEKMRPKCSLLIVDDELPVRESLRVLLKPHYDIYTASNGEEALKILKKHKIHLITLDLNMPKLSGIQTLREIRKINSKVPIVIITGYATRQEQMEAGLYGVKAVISKPFATKTLISAIDRILKSENDCEPPSFRQPSYRLEHEEEDTILEI